VYIGAHHHIWTLAPRNSVVARHHGNRDDLIAEKKERSGTTVEPPGGCQLPSFPSSIGKSDSGPTGVKSGAGDCEPGKMTIPSELVSFKRTLCCRVQNKTWLPSCIRDRFSRAAVSVTFRDPTQP
jgi:hypothetical protein